MFVPQSWPVVCKADAATSQAAIPAARWGAPSSLSRTAMNSPRFLNWNTTGTFMSIMISRPDQAQLSFGERKATRRPAHPGLLCPAHRRRALARMQDRRRFAPAARATSAPLPARPLGTVALPAGRGVRHRVRLLLPPQVVRRDRLDVPTQRAVP